MVLLKSAIPSRMNTKKRYSFHHRGLECKLRKQCKLISGKFELGGQNEAGQRLIQFCQENTLVIANTLFQQHKRPSTLEYHQMVNTEMIGYILCSQGWKNSFSSVQSLSHVRLFANPWTAARQAFLSITNYQNLLKLMSVSQWCHPTISRSVSPFSSCPQSFPASGSFQMSQLFASGGQSTGVSVSTSVLPMNTQIDPL